MNKSDIKLIIVLTLFLLIFFIFKNNKQNKVANVYYENELIKTIDLTIDNQYTVQGYNGEVVIEVKNNKIRVKEETSKNNLCSKQGYADVIVCLPNKIIIKVEQEELDGVVK